ncbi:MAG: CocE/NonD family hydrolase [Candidatus Acidiferrum sp.]
MVHTAATRYNPAVENYLNPMKIFLGVALCCLLTLSLLGQSAPWPLAGHETYSTSVRTSQYVTVRDGTRLAIDIYRPQSAGQPVDRKFPVILVATPYHRSSENNGEIRTFLAPQGNHRNIFAELLKHGYIIASLDLRARGASFGTVYGSGMDSEAIRTDLYDVVEWLAAQPWSDGNIGTGGCSYVGKTQFLAASAAPPHLKAIAPTGAPFDAYSLARVNGVTRNLLVQLDKTMRQLDVDYPAAPVDDDRDGSLRRVAIAEHRISWDAGLAGFTPERAALPFRDSPPPRPEFAHPLADEWNFLPNFKLSKIPVFQYTGWRDLTLDAVSNWYEGLAGEGVTQQLVIGPWYHCEWDQSNLTDAVAEYLSWYDYWLKGIKNAVPNTPRVRYYVVNAPAGHEWQSANQLPLPNEHPKRYFLSAKTAAAGDATLRLEKPVNAGGKDDYVVDYTATAADLPTRFFWGIPNATNPGLIPIKTAALDSKSLTYTTAPLSSDAEVTGFPKLNLFVSSTAEDQDFFVYLEEVDDHGVSTLMTEGILRASNRAIRTPPFANGGIPWHPHLKADQSNLPSGVPAQLDFALSPMSNYVRKGHRLRISINNFDRGANWDTPEINPSPTVTIYHDAQHPSSITLPFIQNK